MIGVTPTEKKGDMILVKSVWQISALKGAYILFTGGRLGIARYLKRHTLNFTVYHDVMSGKFVGRRKLYFEEDV